jgi:hypothetical protein
VGGVELPEEPPSELPSSHDGTLELAVAANDVANADENRKSLDLPRKSEMSREDEYSRTVDGAHDFDWALERAFRVQSPLSQPWGGQMAVRLSESFGIAHICVRTVPRGLNSNSDSNSIPIDEVAEAADPPPTAAHHRPVRELDRRLSLVSDSLGTESLRSIHPR